MLYDSATNQNLCMSSEIKRPALLSTYWPIKISGHQDHVKMIKLISFCREKKRNEGAARPWALLSKCTFRWLTWDSTDARRHGWRGPWISWKKSEASHLQKMGVWNALHPKKKRCSIITAWRLPSLLPFWDTRSNSDPHRKDNEFRGLNSWVLYPAALRPAFLAPEVLWEWRHSNVDHTWESTAKVLQTCDLTNFGASNDFLPAG